MKRPTAFGSVYHRKRDAETGRAGAQRPTLNRHVAVPGACRCGEKRNRDILCRTRDAQKGRKLQGKSVMTRLVSVCHSCGAAWAPAAWLQNPDPGIQPRRGPAGAAPLSSPRPPSPRQSAVVSSRQSSPPRRPRGFSPLPAYPSPCPLTFPAPQAGPPVRKPPSLPVLPSLPRRQRSTLRALIYYNPAAPPA
jgi:hypothetical protein